MDSRASAHHRLRLLLDTLAERAGATCAVVFAPRASGLAIVGRVEIDQDTLNFVQGAWARRRQELESDRLVRYAQTLLWPLFEGPELAVVTYFDRAHLDFPDEESRAHGHVLVKRVRELSVPSAVGTYLARGLSLADATQETLRDQLALAFDIFEGNVTAVAHHLRVSRETVYQRARRLGLEVGDFRRRRRSRP